MLGCLWYIDVAQTDNMGSFWENKFACSPADYWYLAANSVLSWFILNLTDNSVLAAVSYIDNIGCLSGPLFHKSAESHVQF